MWRGLLRHSIRLKQRTLGLDVCPGSLFYCFKTNLNNNNKSALPLQNKTFIFHFTDTLDFLQKKKAIFESWYYRYIIFFFILIHMKEVMPPFHLLLQNTNLLPWRTSLGVSVVYTSVMWKLITSDFRSWHTCSQISKIYILGYWKFGSQRMNFSTLRRN